MEKSIDFNSIDGNERGLASVKSISLLKSVATSIKSAISPSKSYLLTSQTSLIKSCISTINKKK